jgi:hypothetical protein
MIGIARSHRPSLTGLAGCVLVVAIILWLAALARSANDRGRLTGVLIVSGGAAHPGTCGCTREPGIVVLTPKHGGQHRIDVRRSGRFSISLPAGRYQAVGGIPRLGWRLGACTVDSPASPASFRVTAGRTTRITVDCHGK